MSKTPNPYQPPGEIDSAPIDRIEFDGEVTSEDIAGLIGTPKMLWVLRVVLVIVTAPFFVVPWVLMMLGRIPSDLETVLIFFGIDAFMIGLVIVPNWVFSAKSRVRRLIKREPGIVGPLKGHLDAFGMTFFKADLQQYQHHW